MSRAALRPIRGAFYGLSRGRNAFLSQQAAPFASEEHNPNEDVAHKEDYIIHPQPEVPAQIRDHLEDEKWPHASDEERRSDMGRAEDAEMPTELAPTADPEADETPEKKPA